METAITSVGVGILLFLCLYFGFNKIRNEFEGQYCELQTKLDEAQQKLFDYMDLTRKEALDSYRRGLQDGITAANQKPVYAPSRPVKTMDEHLAERQEAVSPPKPDEFTANLLADHARMMDYDGFLPEEKR
jgi:hypothetical protein